MTKSSPANILTNQILNFFFSKRIFAYRQNAQGIFDTRKGIYRPAAKKGVTDILAFLPPNGRVCAIEVKIGQDMQSEEQKGFEININRAGGVYIIARSFPEFLSHVTPHLLPV